MNQLAKIEEWREQKRAYDAGYYGANDTFRNNFKVRDKVRKGMKK